MPKKPTNPELLNKIESVKQEILKLLGMQDKALRSEIGSVGNIVAKLQKEVGKMKEQSKIDKAAKTAAKQAVAEYKAQEATQKPVEGNNREVVIMLIKLAMALTTLAGAALGYKVIAG